MSSQAEAGRFPLSYGKGNVKYGELINKAVSGIFYFFISPLKTELFSSMVGNHCEFFIETSTFYITFKEAARLIPNNKNYKLIFDILQILKQGVGYASGETASIIITQYVTGRPCDRLLRKDEAIFAHALKGIIKSTISKILEPKIDNQFFNAFIAEGISDFVKRDYTHTTINMFDIVIVGLTGGLLKKSITVRIATYFRVDKETINYHSIAVIGDIAKQFGKTVLKEGMELHKNIKKDKLKIEFYSSEDLLLNLEEPRKCLFSMNKYDIKSIMEDKSILKHYNDEKISVYLSNEDTFGLFNILDDDSLMDNPAGADEDSMLIDISFMDPFEMLLNISKYQEKTDQRLDQNLKKSYRFLIKNVKDNIKNKQLSNQDDYIDYLWKVYNNLPILLRDVQRYATQLMEDSDYKVYTRDLYYISHTVSHALKCPFPDSNPENDIVVKSIKPSSCTPPFMLLAAISALFSHPDPKAEDKKTLV
jgi:hypothetical protein